MILSSVSGFPRIGPRRELKVATEGFWAGKVSQADLLDTAARIRRANWEFIKKSGVDLISSNDFSLYDHVLDTICITGAIPQRYGHTGGPVDLDTYFAMARGKQTDGTDVVAMEMTKWFNTNYHYLVPEFSPETTFKLSGSKPVDDYLEAKQLGVETVPVLLGPVSFLLLGKAADLVALTLLDRLLPVYEQLLAHLGDAGATWVQFDEPVFAQDRSPEDLAALSRCYERLGAVSGRPKILIKTYFDHTGEAYPVLSRLPVEGLGLDFVAGAANEDLVAAEGLANKTLFAGVVDGHNVWINDLDRTLALLKRLRGLCAQLVVTNSCSLQHVPLDSDDEPTLDPEVRSWLSFAEQKVGEVVTLTKAMNEGNDAIADALSSNRKRLQSRRTSKRAVNPKVRERVAALSDADGRRSSDYATRRELQRRALDLPPLPTTTIGSYPQTKQVRRVRAQLRKGEMTPEQYTEETKSEIERVIRFQEKAGLDVLVHGEPERNDMVQYFAEMLEGYVFTKNAWVQSYGSRYVRPPIIHGDISRPKPMTVEWTRFAQSLTEKPVKGMLTGPVTMLMWSFVRDDIPRSETCMQLALAVRDEVVDLEAAGIKIIQVDETAIREGLPLHRSAWKEYLDWAVYCFRVATSSVADETQIQTHLCYSEFGDIIGSIDEMDADVALMWCARAGMRLLDDLKRFGYRREVGPGVYDIHSPRIPSVIEMANEIRLATDRLDAQQIWVNPDCGLKTRGWAETEPSLRNMVEAAEQVRAELAP